MQPIELLPHTMTKTAHDGEGHWQVCADCGYTAPAEDHDFSKGDCACGEKAPVEDTEPTQPVVAEPQPKGSAGPIVIVAAVVVAAAAAAVVVVRKRKK